MSLTHLVLKDISARLREHKEHAVEIVSIVQHGSGFVVLYNEHESGSVCHRCAGFDGGLRQSFNMIVDRERT